MIKQITSIVMKLDSKLPEISLETQEITLSLQNINNMKRKQWRKINQKNMNTKT